MRLRVASLLFLAAATCAASRPAFIKGNDVTWTIPLVGPLENAELVIPVTIEGQGPFLMVLDPGSPSAVDREIGDRLGIKIVDLRAHGVDQEDQVVGFRVYEAEGFGPPGMQYYRGNFLGLPRGSFRLANSPVDGLFGALGATLIVDVDRDAGVVRIAYTGHEQAPMGGVRIPMDVNYGVPTVESVIHASKQANAKLMVDLRQPYSRIWASVAREVGISFAADRQVQVGDEYGTWVGVAAPQDPADVVFSRDLPAERVAFAEFNDKRKSEDVVYSGVLGQDILSRHRVLFDQDHEALWLAPRDADLGERVVARISRWPELAACATTGCAAAAVVPPGGEWTGSPRLVVTRSADAPGSSLEIVIQALDAAGKPLALPLLRASLAAGVKEVAAAYLATGAYAQAAAFRVVDASPFPPSCTGESCIVAVGR